MDDIVYHHSFKVHLIFEATRYGMEGQVVGRQRALRSSLSWSCWTRGFIVGTAKEGRWWAYSPEQTLACDGMFFEVARIDSLAPLSRWGRLRFKWIEPCLDTLTSDLA